MIARAGASGFMGMWMSHETDEPLRDAFPDGWGDMGEDALGEAYMHRYLIQSYALAVFALLM